MDSQLLDEKTINDLFSAVLKRLPVELSDASPETAYVYQVLRDEDPFTVGEDTYDLSGDLYWHPRGKVVVWCPQ